MSNNGFVERWQGKILAKLLGIGSGGMTAYTATGGPINVTPNDLASIAGGGTVLAPTTAALVINGYGVNGPLSSVGGSTYAMGAPKPGRPATIFSNVIGDGVRKVSLVASGASIGSSLGAAQFINFSTSVGQQALALIGLSTSSWGVRSNSGPVALSTS